MKILTLFFSYYSHTGDIAESLHIKQNKKCVIFVSSPDILKASSITGSFLFAGDSWNQKGLPTKVEVFSFMDFSERKSVSVHEFMVTGHGLYVYGNAPNEVLERYVVSLLLRTMNPQY